MNVKKFKLNPSNNLIFTQSLAGLSQWLDIFLIFAMPVFVWDASPSEIALIASIFGLPSLFLGPFVGAYLDRTNPFKSMVVGSILRTALSVGIIFSFDIISFGVLVFLKGIANLIYWPSSTILTNHVVTKDDRVSFFSLQGTIDQIIKVSTPLVAGFIVIGTSYSFAFFISAFFSFLCTLSLIGLKKSYTYKELLEKRSIKNLLGDVLNGLSSIKDLNITLKLTIFISICMSLTLAIYDPHLSAFLKSSGLGESTYSLAVSFTGVGAVLGAISVRLWFSDAKAISLVRSGLFFFSLSLF
ncbi:MFS transporter, partial [Endozoicomonas acroporae]|uniref:MFS transporter n=1 Tax=Endozoicomonas acroporae TaxID=1701104 RepID=UPI003D7AB647